MVDNEQDPAVTKRISRRWPILSASVGIIAAVLLGLIIFIRGNTPFEADAEWMEEILEHRNPLWEIPSLAMNYIGGGWVSFAIPLVVVAILLVLRRFWGALFFALALGISPLIVQLLKGLFDRPRPEEILVAADLGSFPSGHSANAATLAVALGFILWRWWVWAAGAVWVVAMMLSRTYLGAHWVSDTIGGVLLGIAVAVIVWAPFAEKLRVERISRQAGR